MAASRESDRRVLDMVLSKLEGIEDKVDSLIDKSSDHETRIVILEKNNSGMVSYFKWLIPILISIAAMYFSTKQDSNDSRFKTERGRNEPSNTEASTPAKTGQ